jgi:hypothetical protein
MKHYKMVVIAVYKRHNFDEEGHHDINMNNNANHETNKQKEEQVRISRKPYVWIHPPKDLELNAHDELFVLCDSDPRDLVNGRNADTKMRTNLDLLGGGGGQGNKFKNEDKKLTT